MSKRRQIAGGRDETDTAGEPARRARSARVAGPAGFTLVEALTGVVVFGILAAIAYPMWHSASFQKQADMRVVSSTLRAAQSRAVTGQTDVAVIIDTDQQVLRIHDDDDRDGAVDPGEHTTAYPLSDRIEFGQGGAPDHATGSGPTTFDDTRDGHPVVVFHRNGAASEAGGIYVTGARAQSGGGDPYGTRLVVVERATGRISWHQYTRDGWKRSD